MEHFAFAKALGEALRAKVDPRRLLDCKTLGAIRAYAASLAPAAPPPAPASVDASRSAVAEALKRIGYDAAPGSLHDESEVTLASMEHFAFAKALDVVAECRPDAFAIVSTG